MATWKIRYSTGVVSGALGIPPKEVPEGATVSFVDHLTSEKVIDASRICYHHGFAGGTIERGATSTFYTVTVWGGNMDDINHVIKVCYSFLGVSMSLNPTLPEIVNQLRTLAQRLRWLATGKIPNK